MKRRTLLGNLAIGSTTAAVSAACGRSTPTAATNAALPSIEWRMVTSWPKALDTIFGGAQELCDRVAAMTGDRFKITPFAAGEIVGGLEVLDAVQNGTVECGHSSSYYYVGKNKAFGFATSVPFGLTAQQQNAWLYSGGNELVNELYADFNTLIFPAGNTGAQMGGWFKNEINATSDLQGLKMRIPGIGGEVMARLGVNVQVLPGGEIFLALDRGTIDAAEWVGPYDDAKLGLQNAAKFYYYPGWWEPGATLHAMVNQGAWQRLPSDYQAAFTAAAFQANASMLAKYESRNQEALQTLLDGGTQLRPYSDEILRAAATATEVIFEETASGDAAFKKIYDPWTQFRDRVRAWNSINELSFESFVAPKLAAASNGANAGTN